jgi:peptidyl-dipeptidase Dcp
MPDNRITATILLTATLLAGCTRSTGAAQVSDLLRAPWSGPHGGAPPFDRVKPDQFPAAFEAALLDNQREIAAITDSSEPPTFENTIAALEGAGRTLGRISQVYEMWARVMGSTEFQAVERELEPRLAASWDEITQNQRLFRRIEAVHASSARATLTPEQRRLLEITYRDFVRAGAALDVRGRQRVAEINQELSRCYTAFSQNVRADEKRCIILAKSELSGLPESLVAAAAIAAQECGGPGKWAVANTRSAVAAFLTSSDRRDLRERVWRNYDNRGDNGDAHDNNQLIREILALRAERATLLGYPTHAHRQLETSMIKTPERALALMEAVWNPAVARVRDEVAAMQAIADREGQGVKIAPWDYRYYAEKVRKATYDVDDLEVKRYLQLETLREGMFWVAGQLFGLDFALARSVPVYHPDVRVFEVTNRADGRHLGLLYIDPYARAGKNNGGQTDSIRVQERFQGEVTALVLNATPFVKPGPGEPALLSWRDAQTMFHEFGHALHVLCSNVAYPSLAGARVVTDYGEFPALLMEKWLATPEVLGRFARHHQTGAAMPAELLAKLQRASTFQQGFYTIDYLTSALVEMKLHLATDRTIDPDAFERDVLAQLVAPEEVGMRFRMPHFTHVFVGEGYSAGYYAYLWSDVLAADAFQAFREASGPYDAALAARLRKHVLSVGNTVDPFEAYRAFRGRDATVHALMRARGFSTAEQP